MPISIKCDCGKTLKVDEKRRGKKAKCPACGSSVLVEELDTDTAVQAGKPKTRPVATDDDDERDDEPRRKKPKRAKAKKSTMPLLVGGGCAVLLLLSCCVFGGGGGAWYFFFRGGDADLAYVNEGAAGFVTVRVADVWKNAKVKDQFKLMPVREKDEMDKKLAEMETKLGMKLEDLERVTIVMRSADIFKGFGNADKDLAVVFRTSKAMDEKKIVSALAKEMNEKEKEVLHEGARLHVFRENALVFPSDRIVIMAPTEAVLKDVLKKSKQPTKHPALRRGIDMAASGRHQLVSAFELKKDLMKGLPPELVKQAPNARDLTGVINAITIAQDLSIETVLTFPSTEIAGKAKGDVDALMAVGKVGVKALPKAGPALVKFMESVKVEQRGGDVVVTARTDFDVKGFGDMPGFPLGGGLGGGGGGPRIQSINNLKQIGLAMHGFHDAYKSLPNHAMRHQKTGQSLLSWRVELLPYLDQAQLYNQIRRDEPWDSQHNRQFWNQMPAVYQLPGRPNDGRTFYQVFQGNESVFPKSIRPPNFPGSGITMVSITDGTSNTIFVTEAANAVNWMQPDDIPFQMKQQGLVNRVGNHWGNETFLAVMGDGTVRTFRRPMTDAGLQAFITRAGNEPVVVPDF